jgi:hypothetical protein
MQLEEHPMDRTATVITYDTPQELGWVRSGKIWSEMHRLLAAMAPFGAIRFPHEDVIDDTTLATREVELLSVLLRPEGSRYSTEERVAMDGIAAQIHGYLTERNQKNQRRNRRRRPKK